MVELLNIDCMEYMATLPDKAFDLAVVDPPYGINIMHSTWSANAKDAEFSCSKNSHWKQFKLKDWDKQKPKKDYFNQLLRVCGDAIIWGGNYFSDMLPPTRCFLIWNKVQRGLTMGDCEMAWSSFDKVPRVIDINRFVFIKEPKIHMAQKPVALYDWILRNYAKPGQRILDTHLGSGSSAIAAHYFGCDFVGCEIDVDYFNAAKERFVRETRQVAMW